MTSFVQYSDLCAQLEETPLSAPPPQDAYHWRLIQSKEGELLRLGERYEKKCKKYAKISDRLVWLNASSSGITLASGILSVATLSTFIGLPVSIPLAAVSLTGAGIGGITTALTKKYQRKLSKVTKLTDIVTSALAVFEMSASRALNDGRIDEREFAMLQRLHFKVLSELAAIDCKMEAEMRAQLQNSLLEKMGDLERKLKPKDA